MFNCYAAKTQARGEPKKISWASKENAILLQRRRGQCFQTISIDIHISAALDTDCGPFGALSNSPAVTGSWEGPSTPAPGMHYQGEYLAIRVNKQNSSIGLRCGPSTPQFGTRYKLAVYSWYPRANAIIATWLLQSSRLVS